MQLKSTTNSINYDARYIVFMLLIFIGFPRSHNGEESACQWRRQRNSGLITRLGRSPGEGNGNPFSVLAWKFPWVEKSDRLQSMGLQRVGHNWATEQIRTHTHRHSLGRKRESINCYKTDVLFAKYFGESFQIIPICQIYCNKACLIP